MGNDDDFVVIGTIVALLGGIFSLEDTEIGSAG